MTKSTFETRVEKILDDLSYGNITEEHGKVLIAYELFNHLGITMTKAIDMAATYFPKVLGEESCYTEGYNVQDLRLAKKLSDKGQKIEAIKMLRDTISPKPSLRLVKEIVENLCQ